MHRTNQPTLAKRAPRWLSTALLLIPVLLGACSVANLPTASSRQSAQASPTPGTSSQQSGVKVTPRTEPAAQPTQTQAPLPPQQGGAAWQVPAEQQAVVQVVERAGPAVVTVVNRLDSSQGFTGEARGSGVIIDEQGHIVTNNHVVEGAAEGGLTVIFSNGESVAAQLAGSDQISDLAVLKVSDAVPATVPLGDSDNMKVGETVIAIGSALGDFQNTVTVGVVSGLNRTLKGDNGINMENMIQTDAAINHGNSGGPLLNLSGEVVAINTAVVRSTGSDVLGGSGDVAEGLGFAIPVNTAKSVVAQLIQTGKVTRPYLGVTTRPLSAMLGSYLRLRDENGSLLDHGVQVTDVSPGSGANKAGVQPNDVITKIDGVTIDDNHPLINVLMTHQPSDTVTLTIVRDGKALSLKATLGTRP